MTNPLDTLRDATEAADKAKAQVREAIVSARAAGESVPAIAEAAGLTRQRVYQIVAEAKPAPDAAKLRARLEELDAKWEALVDKLAPRQGDRRYRAGYPAVTRAQNTANGKSVKRGRGRIYTDVTVQIRNRAESELLAVLQNRGDEPVVQAIVRDLDEAAALRKQLATLDDSGVFRGI